MRPVLLADAVDEKLHLAAARTVVDIEILLVDEQLAEIAKDTPAVPS